MNASESFFVLKSSYFVVAFLVTFYLVNTLDGKGGGSCFSSLPLPMLEMVLILEEMMEVKQNKIWLLAPLVLLGTPCHR